MMVHDEVIFVDQGENFEEVRCPSCKQSLDVAWWQDAMEAAGQAKLEFKFMPRGMRRTFNDLARAASIEAIVTRSMSGHLTEGMQNQYSTVRGPEQREGISRVVDLMTPRKNEASGAPSGSPSTEVVLPSTSSTAKLPN